MAKTLYYPYEIVELLNNKISEMTTEIVNGDKTDADILKAIGDVRTCKKFVGMIADDLVEADGND